MLLPSSLHTQEALPSSLHTQEAVSPQGPEGTVYFAVHHLGLQ